ncbi:MAG: glycoside hydrolase family 78 protein [Chloroflexi bacterium]|nr:glycoside hydrolase family 78 protein [Chloroflexota bacterium]
MTPPLTVHRLRCEYLENPLGLDEIHPRFGWQLLCPRRGAMQRAWQVRVVQSKSELDTPLWDSGQIASDRSQHIAYAGPDLAPSTRYFWQARVWDDTGNDSGWSEAAWWETGLLSPANWRAGWITPDLPDDTSIASPAPLLRREFATSGPVAAARLYITARGLYEARINGQPITDALFTPGWTSYGKRLQYQVYDVTDLLQEGNNALSVMLGDGWYRGRLGWEGKRNLYGDKLGLLAELHIRYANGETEIVTSDEKWRAAEGAIRAADIYDGESYDARLEQPGWDAPGFDDSGWAGVLPLDAPTDTLIGSVAPPVRRQEEFAPLSITPRPDGTTIVDFGQLLTGWVRLRVTGEAGQTVTIRHAEVLDREGNFYVENLRTARQTNHYTLRGGGEEVYEPTFTFQGFRYIELSGYPGPITGDSVTGVVLHSDLTPTGIFECSNPDVNQLQHNILWGQKGNFLDVPTDCPQRDERLGWTGDVEAFLPTAAFNLDVSAFFTKWFGDLNADQRADGAYPHVSPHILPDFMFGACAWGDVSIIGLWALYTIYGDTRLLERYYSQLQVYVDFVRGYAGDDLLADKPVPDGFHFGDWLNSDAPSSNGMLATAFFAHSARLLGQIAAVLGKRADAGAYRELAALVAHAFCREYMTPNGRIDGGQQTAYVLALAFDLLPQQLRAQAANRLVADICQRKNHLSTGFIGAPRLSHALSDNGKLDTAYDLLLQDSFPGWLYQVKNGATTMWERWDSLKPDGSFQTPEMNSFNHYAYGSIGHWLYRVVAGLDVDPAAPAYKHSFIRPQPGGDLTWAKAEYESVYGKVISDWRQEEGSFHLSVTVPANARATVYLPAASAQQVTESGLPLAEAPGVQSIRQSNGELLVQIGSGTYTFVVA